MAEPTTELGALIRRVKEGDTAAREALFATAFAQLERMARKRLDQQFGRLRFRGIDTGDVLDDALVQMVKRLEQGSDLDRLAGERDFFIMAAQYIRWALLNTANRLAGQAQALPPDDFLAGETVHPFSLEHMTAFHGAVEQLPREQRDVFELLYFCGRTYEEAADLLGVHRDTVKRRYRDAKETLKTGLEDFVG
jgi:RNA polymerase sigma factor (sigma-70 family)